VTTIAGWLGSLPSPAIYALVTTLSAAVAALCLRIRQRMLRWTLAVVVPFVIAWCTYWAPVWAGRDPSEYGPWAPLFIVPWGLCGVVGAALVFVVKRAATRSRPS
jgi:hypothetical protein